MNHVRHRCRQRRVGRTEVDGEIESTRSAAADGSDRRPIKVGIEGNVCSRNGYGSEGVDFDVRSCRRLFVDCNSFDHVGAAEIIGPRSADGVVRPIQTHRVVWAAAPGEVLVRPDD